MSQTHKPFSPSYWRGKARAARFMAHGEIDPRLKTQLLNHAEEFELLAGLEVDKTGAGRQSPQF